MLLADLGAEVINIEEPKQVSRALRLMHLDRNRKRLTLNLKFEKGREIFYKLAEKSDVILEGFRPGVTKRLGIDYQTIKEINPRIIYCAISGYGQDGPYRDLVGHDINYMGMAGALGLTGKPDGPPIIPAVQVADLGGGAQFAAIGILTALVARQRTGKGQFIDVSMLDGVISWMLPVISAYLSQGKSPVRGEEMLTGGVPCYNVYETRDGKYLSLGALEEKFWNNLCTKLGREDLREHQFASGGRGKGIISILQEIFLTKTRDEWLEELKDVDICCGPVNTIEEVVSNHQIMHRKMLVELDHPDKGKVKQVGIPIKFSETPGEIKTSCSSHSQHTIEILRDLGYTEKEIEELRREEVV